MEGESLEWRVNFCDGTRITRIGTIAEVMKDIDRDVKNVVVGVISATDDVLAVGSSDDDEFSSARFMLDTALMRAERIKATRFTLQFPQWEPLTATGG